MNDHVVRGVTVGGAGGAIAPPTFWQNRRRRRQRRLAAIAAILLLAPPLLESHLRSCITSTKRWVRSENGNFVDLQYLSCLRKKGQKHTDVCNIWMIPGFQFVLKMLTAKSFLYCKAYC